MRKRNKNQNSKTYLNSNPMKNLILILFVVFAVACSKDDKKYNLPNDCEACVAYERVYKNNVLEQEYIYAKNYDKYPYKDTTYKTKSNFCDWLNKFETGTKIDKEHNAKFVVEIICP